MVERIATTPKGMMQWILRKNFALAALMITVSMKSRRKMSLALSTLAMNSQLDQCFEIHLKKQLLISTSNLSEN